MMSNELHNSRTTLVTKYKIFYMKTQVLRSYWCCYHHNCMMMGIVPLIQLCRHLGGTAEELGAEIFLGFAADEAIAVTQGQVKGVVAKDACISKDETRKLACEAGMSLLANQISFAEGARGSCTQ